MPPPPLVAPAVGCTRAASRGRRQWRRHATVDLLRRPIVERLMQTPEIVLLEVSRQPLPRF
jgi:hypothetical protein